MKRSSIVLFVSLTVLAGCGKEASILPKEDKELIQGTWVLVKLENAGKAENEMTGALLTFNNGQATLKEPDRPGKDGQLMAAGKEIPGTYILDGAKNPKELDLVMTEGKRPERLAAIFKIDGDTLVICMAEDKQPRPTAFTTAGT